MKRSERLQLRLTPTEKAMIAARALEAGMKLSDYARHRLLGKRIARVREFAPRETPLHRLEHENQELPDPAIGSCDDEIRDMHA